MEAYVLGKRTSGLDMEKSSKSTSTVRRIGRLTMPTIAGCDRKMKGRASLSPACMGTSVTAAPQPPARRNTCRGGGGVQEQGSEGGAGKGADGRGERAGGPGPTLQAGREI